jgi:DNA mismatch repair protein MutH
VFYDRTAIDPSGWRVVAVHRWQPEQHKNRERVQQIHKDWESIHAVVCLSGSTEGLSERNQLLLAASSCGTKRADRCFSLKQWFNQELFLDSRDARAGLDAVYKLRGGSGRGRTVGVVARKKGIPYTRKRKDWASGVVRKALGAPNSHANPPDVAQAEMDLRCPSVSADRAAQEPLSLARLRSAELTSQVSFEDTKLMSVLQGTLFVPLLSEANADQRLWRIQEPLVWRPTVEQLATLGEEWRRIRRAYSRGVALPTAGQSRMLFAKRKGSTGDARDAHERLPAAFWITREFVTEVIRAQSHL